MKKEDIIKAWRDREAYDNLSEAERALLPAHPAGILGLEDEILNNASGGLTLHCTTGDPTSIICSPCPPRQCP
jgi:mersacidin/lichenicidin family type 2 lantibiotic